MLRTLNIMLFLAGCLLALEGTAVTTVESHQRSVQAASDEQSAGLVDSSQQNKKPAPEKQNQAYEGQKNQIEGKGRGKGE